MTTPEQPRVPAFIDANARHRMRTLRVLCYAALAGREGVLEADDMKVRALSTPGPSITVDPGTFGVLARHVGGDFEAYVDKLPSQLTRGVNPTDAAVGGRTDLVVARVLNPYVTETGVSIPAPASAQDGPYWDIQVIEGVTPNINSVTAWNANMSAIPLARIVRPANTGIVQQSHIVDLRSLVDLSGERIVIIDNPPPDPPPIAQQLWTGVADCTGVTSSYTRSQTSFTNWPAPASWQVPVPSWAKTADVIAIVNPEINGNVYGELQLTLDGTAIEKTPTRYNYNYARTIGPEQYVTTVMGSFPIPSGKAGKIVNLRMQGRSLSNNASTHPGTMTTHTGCYVHVQINFKRTPV